MRFNRVQADMMIRSIRGGSWDLTKEERESARWTALATLEALATLDATDEEQGR